MTRKRLIRCKTKQQQQTNLIYSVDKEGENVLKTVIFSEKEDENDFEMVMTKFQAHFMPKNTIHEKAMFYLSAQHFKEYNIC